MTQENKQGERHTWSIENLSTKDLKNSNLWPFKVVRDKGSKISKMECRSLSALEKSFENTSYNISNCPRVLSRYTLLFNALSKLKTQNITHLYITSDYFCYKMEDNTGKTYIGAQNYISKNLYTIEDIKGLCNSVLVKSKIMTRKIDEVFQMYKKTGQYQNVLYDTVSKYINSRTHMKEIDTSKGFIDILNSDLNFSSLKYLFFGTKDKSMYLQEIVSSELLNSISGNILSPLGKELNVYQSKVFEEKRFKNYVIDLRNNKGYRTIRKVFYVTNNLLDSTNKEEFEKLFEEVECFTFSKLKCVYISDAEQKRIEKEKEKKAEEKRKQEEAEKALKMDEITRETEKIMTLLYLMYKFSQKSKDIYTEAENRNSIELSIWAKNYNLSIIKNRIDTLFGQNKFKEDERFPIVEILENVLLKLEGLNWPFLENPKDILENFSENIRPSFFMDNRKHSDIHFETLSDLNHVKSILRKIKEQITILYEIYLGVQFANFGSFMKRYTKNGISIAKLLIPNLVNKYKDIPFYITEKVLENANACFYMVCLDCNTLEKYNKDSVEVDENYKGYNNFVMEYLQSLTEKGVNKLIHSDITDEEDREDMRNANLIRVSKGVSDILNQCYILQNLEIEKSLSDFFEKFD